MRGLLATLVFLLGAAAAAVYGAAFIVHQNEQALVLRFGQPISVITKPGLNWKLPFIETVEFFDKRILDLDTSEQEVTASDQKRLVVDAYARYRITDPLKFYQNVRDERRVRVVLGPIMDSAIRRVLGAATLQDVVKDKRETLMREIASQVNREGRDYGVEVVDVRIKRADLPQQNLQNVFQRMQADRIREATEIRALGEAEGNRIRANADREVTIIKAEANKRSELLRGEGDAERNRIFAEAYGRDPDFFAFYRSMQAYEQSLRPGDTRLVISPDSQFFRFFNDPTGKRTGGTPAPAASPRP
jgi:membrane protease subunit HflC